MTSLRLYSPPSPSRATADRTSRPAWWAPESGRAHGPWRGSGTPHRTTPWLGPPPRASKMDILAIRHMGSRVFYVFVNRYVNTCVNINFGVYESIYDYIYIYINKCSHEKIYHIYICNIKYIWTIERKRLCVAGSSDEVLAYCTWNI